MKKVTIILLQLLVSINIAAQSFDAENSLRKVIKQITTSDSIRYMDPTDFGYPHYMVAASEMMGEMYPAGGPSYDWFTAYNSGITDSYRVALISWYTSYNIINKCNSFIKTYSKEVKNESSQERAALGAVYAIRAYFYYILMVLYEPVSNIYTDCSGVIGLTVPLVDENTTEEKLANNPRISHSEMIKFILSDLDIAENALTNFHFEDKTIPNLSVVYGIKAKVYLWDEDYSNAAKYARKAIDEAESRGAFPLSATEWEEPTTGFNTARPAWMWYVHPKATSIYSHFISWMSPEAEDNGYASVTLPVIDRALYEKIGEFDFRKKTFLNPNKNDYYRYLTALDQSFIANAPDYLAIKFRRSLVHMGWVEDKYGGYSTDITDYDLPIMRIEEMYLIEAEAVGVSEGLSNGINKLNGFVKKYRDPEYNFITEELRTFQIEVLNQMHIEFWGEGKAFAIAKRLKPGVMQNYTGTNAPFEYLINCKGIKPVWNMVIPQDAIEKNKALAGKNNPTTSDCISIPSPVGQYSPGKYKETGIDEVKYEYNKEIIYNIDGKKLNHYQKGINIVRTKDGKAKKIAVK